MDFASIAKGGGNLCLWIDNFLVILNVVIWKPAFSFLADHSLLVTCCKTACCSLQNGLLIVPFKHYSILVTKCLSYSLKKSLATQWKKITSFTTSCKDHSLLLCSIHFTKFWSSALKDYVKLMIFGKTYFHSQSLLFMQYFPTWRNLQLNYFSFSLSVELKLNPFSTNVPRLYPLKTSENRRFSDIFRGCRSGKHWLKIS